MIIHKSKRMRFYYFILFIFLLTCIPSLIGLINNQKPIFEIKEERVIQDYSLTTANESLKGSLYEIDVLLKGEVTSEIIDEYVKNIVAPEGAISINIKFYDSYNINSTASNYSFLKYEIVKVL